MRASFPENPVNPVKKDFPLLTLSAAVCGFEIYVAFGFWGEAFLMRRTVCLILPLTITIILLEKENGFGILVGVFEDNRGV